MTVIVCIDKKRGMSFNHRRQSSDRKVREEMLKLCEGKRLWMNPESSDLFEEEIENNGNVCVAQDFLEKAEKEDFCFVENCGLKPYMKKMDRIVCYQWNREYPSDLKLDVDLKKWRRISKRDFEGNSHKKITEEVWDR